MNLEELVARLTRILDEHNPNALVMTLSQDAMEQSVVGAAYEQDEDSGASTVWLRTEEL